MFEVLSACTPGMYSNLFLAPFFAPCACLVSYTATRKEELNMPVFTAHQNMAWPQLHEDSIPELAFWRALAKLMAVCGVNDFARDDLARPDPKRLRKQLSGLINFAKVGSSRCGCQCLLWV